MADAQVLYAEDLAGTTAASTAWVDTAIIAAASFTASKRYLIIAHIISTFSTANGEARSRLVHGTTPTVFPDASLAHEGLLDTQEHEEFWLYDYTQPGTTELVKIQISSSGTATHTCRIAQILAINLDDVGVSGTDYFWAEDLVDYTMTATPTAKATTASFTPNGTDRWLFIGHMIEDVVGITTPIGFELYDSVAGILNSFQNEGEDGTNEFRGNNLYWVGIPTNAARTLAVRPFDSGSGIMLASRVIAINLARFAQSASVFSATGVDPATTPTYTTLATVSPTPTNTGNWVYLGFSNQNVNEATTDWETRIQVNAGGGGLVSDPAYPTTAPSIDQWDITDETPHAIFNLASLTSGAARDINWDCRQVAGTTGRMEDNGLVAFSVALATTGYTLNLESGSYALSGAAATLLKTKLLALTAGAYALTGLAATLFKGYSLALNVGGYALSGQALTTLATRLLNLAAGGYSLSGQNATLAKGYLFNAETGSYLLSGQAAALLAGRLLNLQTGSYLLTGQAATLLATLLLSLNTGSYALTGQPLTTLAARLAALNAGSYALSGQALTVLAARLTALNAGAYTLTGQPAALLASRLLVLNAGSYPVTGFDANLSADVASTFTLSLAAGLYAFSGANTELYVTVFIAVGTVFSPSVAGNEVIGPSDVGVVLGPSDTGTI